MPLLVVPLLVVPLLVVPLLAVPLLVVPLLVVPLLVVPLLVVPLLAVPLLVVPLLVVPLLVVPLLAVPLLVVALLVLPLLVVPLLVVPLLVVPLVVLPLLVVPLLVVPLLVVPLLVVPVPAVKLAPTSSVALTVITQLSAVPEQAPVQPSNVSPDDGAALSVTVLSNRERFGASTGSAAVDPCGVGSDTAVATDRDLHRFGTMVPVPPTGIHRLLGRGRQKNLESCRQRVCHCRHHIRRSNSQKRTLHQTEPRSSYRTSPFQLEAQCQNR